MQLLRAARLAVWCAAAVLGLAACSSVPITPAALRAHQAENPRSQRALVLWDEALVLANDFLASDERKTLPPGRFELGDDGMRFVTADRTLPIEVCVTAWGGIGVAFGFDGQERSWGFVVGRIGRWDGDPLLDNSFFLDRGSDWRHPALVASLILHETTHVVYDLGTVSFWKGLAYYLEALFLFRYYNHSDERLPYATSEEFRRWLTATAVFHAGQAHVSRGLPVLARSG